MGVGGKGGCKFVYALNVGNFRYEWVIVKSLSVFMAFVIFLIYI